jgi:chromosome partitioning protein
VIGVVISNQRGGVGKTTTAVNYAGYLSSLKKKVLLIDADSQGSAGTILGLKPARFLHNYILGRERLSGCVTTAGPFLDVLASSRETQQAEAALLGQMAREMSLKMVLDPEVKGVYDFVVIDVAPSITILQSCAMIFAGQVIVPVAMDLLSLQGAQTSIETVRMLNDYYKLDIGIVGFLPTMVNARLQITASISGTLDSLSKKSGVPILPAIRVDQIVHKAAGAKKFVIDYDPQSKAAIDYLAAFEFITRSLEAGNGKAQKA